jgi:hypothetical protein
VLQVILEEDQVAAVLAVAEEDPAVAEAEEDNF